MNTRSSAIYLFFILIFTNVNSQVQNNTSSHLPEKPNIIFIMMDDFDILDMTKYKELFNQSYQPDYEINTPNLDSFFNQALKFTNYHTNGANCSPTRGSLLTGLYPSDLGFYRAVSKNSERGIPENYKLISELLNSNGYTTATVGKWNVGYKGDSLIKPNIFKAYERGFNYSFCSVGCYIDPNLIDKKNKLLSKQNSWVGYGGSYSRFQLEHTNKQQSNLLYSTIGNPNSATNNLDENQYITKINTDKAIAFIEKQKASKSSKPYFLNLWYWLPHGPVHVPLGITENNQLKPNYSKYHLRSNFPVALGTDSKNEIHQVKLSSCDVNTTTTQKAHNLSCNTRLGEYAAMITRLDAAIGRVLDAVKNQPNTLIIITSDNGGANSEHVLRDDSKPNTSSDQSINLGVDPTLVFKGSKNDLYERALRVPLMMRWLGQNNQDLLKNNTVEELVLSREFYPTLTYAAGLMLSDSYVYGNNFFDLLQQNKTSKSYANNSRKEWLVSQNKPVFYENNAGNQPRLVAIDATQYPSCQPQNKDQEEINYAVQNNDWKLVYTTSQWENTKFSSCLPEKTELFKVHANEEGLFEKQNFADKFEHVINYLKLLRQRWQHSIGQIQIDKPYTKSLVNNTIKLPNTGQINISDGHFTFATFVKGTACQSNQSAVIAEKSGSWKLYIKENHLSLDVNVAKAGDPTKRSSVMKLSAQHTAFNCETEQHVGFTVLGGRTSGPLVKLYLNGKLVDAMVTTTTKTIIKTEPNILKPRTRHHVIDFKTPYIVINQSDLIIGNNAPTHFIESIYMPVMYVNPLSNNEMNLLSKSLRFERHFSQFNKVEKIKLNQDTQYSNPRLHFNNLSNNENFTASLTNKSSWKDSPLFGFSADIELADEYSNKQAVIAHQQNAKSSWVLSVKQNKTEAPLLILTIQTEPLDSVTTKCNAITLSGEFQKHITNKQMQTGFMIKNNNVNLFINNVPVSYASIKPDCKLVYNKKVNLGNLSTNAVNRKDFQKFTGFIDNLQILPHSLYSIDAQNSMLSGEVISFKENNKGAIIKLKAETNNHSTTVINPFIYTSTLNIFNKPDQEPIHIAQQSDNEAGGWKLTAVKDTENNSNGLNLELSISNMKAMCEQTFNFNHFKIAPFEEHHLGIVFNQYQLDLYLDSQKVQTATINPKCMPQHFNGDINLSTANSNNSFTGYMYVPKIWHNETSEAMIKWSAVYLDKFMYH